MRWHWVVACGWLLADCSKSQSAVSNAVPSPPGNAATWSGGAPVTFAISQIFLGDVDRNFNANAPIVFSEGGCGPSVAGAYYSGDTSWKAYGYDLDHRITSKDSMDVCTLTVGAPRGNQTDGHNGNDNAWGADFVGLAGINVSTDESNIIQSGAWTLQIQIDGVPTSDVIGVHARVFTAASFPGTPTFDGTTDWPVLASSVVDGQTIAGGALIEDDGAYVTGTTFVSAPSSDMPIALPIQLDSGITMLLRVHHAVVTFSVSASDPTTLTNGTIAGTLDTEELIATLAMVGHRVSPSLCGAAFEGIAEQIRQLQDILLDGTNHDGVACNAISIGIGFNAKRIANPTTVVPDPPPPVDPCTVTLDAGTDSGDP
jgi:hypothetical protein